MTINDPAGLKISSFPPFLWLCTKDEKQWLGKEPRDLNWKLIARAHSVGSPDWCQFGCDPDAQDVGPLYAAPSKVVGSSAGWVELRCYSLHKPQDGWHKFYFLHNSNLGMERSFPVQTQETRPLLHYISVWLYGPHLLNKSAKLAFVSITS